MDNPVESENHCQAGVAIDMQQVPWWHTRLNEAGIRATRKRVLVMEVLLTEAQPITAAKLHGELLGRGNTVGLTTVYRALSSLVDAGLAHAFTQTGETTYRVCGPTRHHHLICRTCGLVTEEATKKRPDGFRVEEVYGICGDCAVFLRPANPG
ncbi:Fur family transcriptional regulator [Streptosporangium sp. NPDC006013]|uniref:Fur family transcriptional regulator n=1 Tax=Streptosporangium sp. NPDC006013 TaxID=3155596 RepID=UPI0033BC27F3